MKSLSKLCAAVVITWVMCFVRVGYAQSYQVPPHIFPSNNVKYIWPTPPVSSGYHDTGHVVPSIDWEIGKVFERTHGSLNVSAYSGSLNWRALRPIPTGIGWSYDTYWDTGTATVNPLSNTIRVPSTKMQGGDIYFLVAELDGEIYSGYNSHPLAAPVPSEQAAIIPIWTYGSYGSLRCPGECYKLTGPYFPPLAPTSCFTFTNNIYLHPKSTIVVTAVSSGGSTANLPITYFYGSGSSRMNKYIKPTDSSGTCYFNVNYQPSDYGFAAYYDGCWHPIPKSSCNNLCFSGAITAGRVTATIKQYNVPVSSCQAWVLDGAGTTYNTPQASPLPSELNTGKVYFTPPSGQQYSLLIKIGNENFFTNAMNASTNPVSITVSLPGQKSPANGSYHKLGNPVPLSWYPCPGASTYTLWLQQQGSSSWQTYNLGNSTSANLTGVGLGSWYWDIEVKNSAGQAIAMSEGRTFNVTVTGLPQMAPINPMEVDGVLDELWDEEFGEGDDSLAGEGVSSVVMVQDEDGNVLLPIQGLQRTKLENKSTDTIEIRKIVPDDWWYLFMTPEEQLFYDFWFGNFGSL